MKGFRTVMCVIVFGGFFVSSRVPTAYAQTTFNWPSSKIDVSSYKYIEKCAAVLRRIDDSISAVLPYVRDTIPMAQRDVGAPLQPDLIAGMSRCMEKYDPAAIVIDDVILAQRLYLTANLDEKAHLAADRIFQETQAFDTVSRPWKMDSVIRNFLAAQPVRLRQADDYLQKLQASGVQSPWVSQLGIRKAFVDAALRMADDTAAIHHAREMLRILRNVPSEDQSGEFQQAFTLSVAFAIDIVYRKELLDSLRKGTDSYKALKNQRWLEVTGTPSSQSIVGELAPKVQGDMWYPSEVASTSYPVRGRVTMVHFLDYSLSSRESDLIRQAALRRLAARFPDLQIVNIAAVKGFFGALEPPTRHSEGDLMRQLFQDVQQYPGVFAVSIPTVVTLDSPDNRKIYQLEVNRTTYPTADGRPVRIGSMYLIGEDGRVIDNVRLDPVIEAKTFEFIATALQRARERQSP